MKLTSDMLRQIIKEEITRAENAPVSLTPRQLKKLIVTESSRVLAEQKSYSDLNRQVTIVDMQLPGFVKVKGKNASIETAMKAALGEVKSLLKALPGEDLEKTFKKMRLGPNSGKQKGWPDETAKGFDAKDFQSNIKLVSDHLKKSEHAEVKDFGVFLERYGKSLRKYREGGFERGTSASRARAARATISSYRSGQIKKGVEVRLVQQALDKLGYDIGKSGADSDYGPSTRKAIIKFQKDNKLAADGLAGSNTLKALISKLGGTEADIAAKEKDSYDRMQDEIEGFGESVNREKRLSEGLADELSKMIGAKSVVGARSRRRSVAAKRKKKDAPAVGQPKAQKGAEVEADAEVEAEVETKPEEPAKKEMGKVELSVLMGPTDTEPPRGFYNRYGKYIGGPLKRKSKAEKKAGRMEYLRRTDDADLIEKRVKLATHVGERINAQLLPSIDKSHPLPRNTKLSYMVPVVGNLSANVLSLMLLPTNYTKMISRLSKIAKEAAEQRNADLSARFEEQDAKSSQARRAIAYKYDREMYDQAVQAERDMGIGSFFAGPGSGGAPRAEDYVGIA